MTVAATSMNRLVERMAEAKRESRTLAALRTALLPKLISGELRIRAVRKAEPEL